MTSGASLELHMTEISKTMLQLAQAHEKIASTQQQNHQTMVTVQQQQANAFEALAAATQQQKYDAMFTAVPRYDGKNKEQCAVSLNQISSLATLAGCSLRLEVLNRSEVDVTTVIAGMDDTISDDDLKEEIMRCFSNAPTMIQAIGVLRSIRHNKMSKHTSMQLDMNLSTTGHTISSLSSRLKSVRSSTMHQPYYPISRGSC